MKGFFNPESVAVLGVSPKETNLGRKIVRNLIEFDFQGILFPVGPSGGVQFGRRIYRSVVDIPDRVDLAIVLTPAKTLPDVMEQLGEKGVRRAIVETAGFREFGAEGRELESRFHEVARKHGIRFIGPNCIGVMNRHNGLAVPFLTMKNEFRQGGVTIITQSGGVGISYLNALASENIGLRCFASIGNKIDVDENDLLEYFLEDPETEIICLYLESISDGGRLMELARRAEKPILVHKSNVGRLSQTIAASHTASISGDDDITDAALRQCGITRFYEPAELINYLKILPLPRIGGNRLAVVSRSGGHAIIAADECEASGFDLAQLPDEFYREVESHMRAKVINLTNPLDLGDLFDLEVYQKIIHTTLNHANVDGVVFLHTYMAATEGQPSRQLIDRVMEMAYAAGKPLTVCPESDATEVAALKKDVAYPVFDDVESAVRSLALARDYRSEFAPAVPAPEVVANRERVAQLLDKAAAEGRDPMLDEAMSIFETYGLPTLPCGLAQDEDQAVSLAESFAYPVVLKVVAPEASHKSDLGGVQINLKDEEAVRNGFREIVEAVSSAAPNANIDGVLVQPIDQAGTELIVGGKRDAQFGPAIMVGIGGIFVEVFREIATRIAPFPRETATRMIESLSIYPVLKGTRGQKPYDVETVVDILLRVSRLMLDFPQIAEFDLNPVRVHQQGKGAALLDARLILSRDS